MIMLFEQTTFTNIQKEQEQFDMSNYPNILTPPSSSEDSPQPMYYARSPNMCVSPQSYALSTDTSINAPYLKILEQPIDRFRFRYKSEMTGTHGSLTGMKSDKTRKQTYPTVQLFNFNEPAVLRCSIYQYKASDENMPHAHRLIKKHGKNEVDDPHNVNVSAEDGYQHVFHSMGIIHTAKKNLIPELIKKKTELKLEEIARNEGKRRKLSTKEEVEIRGLAEAESKSINLNIVCLRFDAFVLKDSIPYPVCPPVYSHGINNLKSALTGELKIVRMDHCTSPTKGGREVFILVERVTKKNVKVRFYELDDEDTVVWEDYGKFSDLDVHHQYAIVFKTPPYKNLNIPNPVKVYIELERPSDRARSEPKEFTYIVSGDSYKPGAKRSRPSYTSGSYDSSNLPSGELPETINNLYVENSNLNYNLDNAELVVNSAELQAALNNIDSSEFNKMFIDFGEDYKSLCLDAPRDLTKKETYKPTNVRIDLGRSVIPKSVSDGERLLAMRTFEEIRDFIKTNPPKQGIIKMLHHYLATENITNALHVAVKQNNLQILPNLLRVVHYSEQNHLFNVKNVHGETLLHIAVECNNEKVVQQLLIYKADPTLTDSNINTVLHIAAANNISTEIMERLLAVNNIQHFIDNENNEGNTALNLAIDNENVTFVKLLCLKGADINKRHKKNGYTPLRFALEKQHLEMIKYILNHSDNDPLTEDFQGINPLQASLTKCSGTILDVVSEYMGNNNYSHIEIKKEIDDFSDEEIEQKFNIKLEEVPIDEIKEKLSKLKKFTPECLDQVSAILDESGSWQNLADLLDLGHLIRSDLLNLDSSPTRLLLNFAIESSGETVLQVRDFLEILDESQAVEIIDKMVTTYN